MKTSLFLLSFITFVTSQLFAQDRLFKHTDPECIDRSEKALTVDLLKKMVVDKQFEKLNDLFNNQGLNMESLPVGLSQGTGAGVFGTSGTIGNFLEWAVERNWKGKLFHAGSSLIESTGENRMKQRIAFNDPISTMAPFKTQLLNKHSLVPNVKSNFVILNYHKSFSVKPTLQERILSFIPVYDIMVAVKGKYGPIYVGKTWYGKYDENGEFSTSFPNKLVAWYFLDFNKDAVKLNPGEKFP